ncbi:MAG: asparagine synthase (glutamine-hydrolyzing) [Kiritimatiellales bacterium]
MCGIIGYISRTGKPDEHHLQQGIEALEKRGPDSSGIYIDKNVGLGFRRLAILDLSTHANQPMTLADHSVSLVFNGEIYNYKDIRKSLNLDSLQSTSDTEVLLKGYEKKGNSIVSELDGMFAIGLYDKIKNKIILARDHFGKKPLYYYHDSHTFAFASEIKALLQIPDVKKHLEIDPLSISKILFYGYIPSPHSIFGQIKKLEPATCLEFSIEQWRISNKTLFWNLHEMSCKTPESEEEVLSTLDHLLRQSVKKRLISDVPVGMFLSGGLDSTLVGSYLKKLDCSVDTYTVSYSTDKNIDETKFAKIAADRFGLNYHFCEFDSSHVLPNFIEIMDYLDEPLADAAIVPLYFLSKQAKQDFTVTLSGDGGDEVFGGYTKYKVQYLIEKLSLLKFLIPALSRLPLKGNIEKLLNSFHLPLAQRQFILGSGSFLSKEASEILLSSFPPEKVFEDAVSHLASFNSDDVINSCLFLDCKIQLPDWYLVKGDRATMANSQEMRTPLLDKNLTEYLFSLPGNYKVRNGEAKYLEKKLLAKEFPREFVNRRKRGFGVPLDSWIKNELKEVFNEYLFEDHGYFNMKYVKQLHDEHLAGRKNNQFKLLRIFTVNHFLNKWA